LTIDSIINGYVIDHIKAGKGMEIYNILDLDSLDCQVAIIKNASSKKMGKKDIIKIDGELDLKLDILGYAASDITVNIIRDGKLVGKEKPQPPATVEGVIKCRNPRCITTTEQDIKHIFKLTDKETREYRCLYCEAKAE